MLEFPGCAGGGRGRRAAVRGAAQPHLSVLKIGQIAEDFVREQPKVKQAHRYETEKILGEEAEVQNEKLHLDSVGLLAAETDSVSSGEGWVGKNVVVGKTVAVGGNDAGN